MAKTKKSTKKKRRKNNNRIVFYVVVGLLVFTLVAGSLSFLVPQNSTGQQQNEEAQAQQNALPFSDIHALSFDPSNANTYLLGTHENLFSRRASGQEWLPVSQDTKGRDIMSLVFNPDTQQFTAGGHGSLLVSKDSGKSWNTSEKGLPPTPDVHGLASDPSNPDMLYALVAENGIYQSADQGKTWKKIADTDMMGMGLAVNAKQQFFVVGMDGLYRGKIENGQFRTNKLDVDGKQVTGVEVNPKDANLVFATTLNGFYRSEDGGTSWSMYNEGLKRNALFAIGMDDQNPDHLVVIDDTASLYVSNDGGKTWDS